jgi:hypothetical protein
LIEKAATRRAAELPASEREAFIAFVTEEVDFDMTRFYAISAMVDLFEAIELQALASFAATPEGRSALGKLPALGAVLNPIVERQIDDAARDFRRAYRRSRSSHGCGALMTATGWLASLARLRDQRIGDAPWLGRGYGTLLEVFRNTARSTIAAAGSDVTMKRRFQSDTIIIRPSAGPVVPRSGDASMIDPDIFAAN